MLSRTAVNAALTVFTLVVASVGVQVGAGAPGRTRTCGQVLRRHLLCPLSYGRSRSTLSPARSLDRASGSPYPGEIRPNSSIGELH